MDLVILLWVLEAINRGLLLIGIDRIERQSLLFCLENLRLYKILWPEIKR